MGGNGDNRAQLMILGSVCLLSKTGAASTAPADSLLSRPFHYFLPDQRPPSGDTAQEDHRIAAEQGEDWFTLLLYTYCVVRLRTTSSLIVQQLLLLVMCAALVVAQQGMVDQLAGAASRGDKAALQQLITMGNAGNAQAQFNLGVMYGIGLGVVPKDAVQAVNWFRKAAEQGDAASQSQLGFIYANGEGVPKDAVQAVNWFRKAAEQGDAEAQYNLGRKYANGEGVSKDAVQAVNWYRKAAEQGEAAAQANLGLSYAKGEGVPKDAVQAVNWFRKATEKGFAGAQSGLGAMYAAGEGVPKDLVTAYMWRNLAAAQGDEEAKTAREALEKLMTPAQIAEGQKLSREWKPKK